MHLLSKIPPHILLSVTLSALLLSSLILLIGLGLLAWFTKRYSDFWFRTLVGNKIDLVNEVLTSEELPRKWHLTLLERFVSRNNASSIARHLRALLKRWYLFRLDRLIQSLRHASFIDRSENAEFLTGLQEIRNEWLTRQDLF